jgi:hypothetical protein
VIDLSDLNTIATVRNSVSLDEHMRRTVLLEAAVIPLQRDMVRVRFIVPVITGIGAICGAIYGVLHLLKVV